MVREKSNAESVAVLAKENDTLMKDNNENSTTAKDLRRIIENIAPMVPS